MKTPVLASSFSALALSLGSFLLAPLCRGQQGYDPQLPYTYAQQPGTGAYSPGPGYQTSPYGQQPVRQTRRSSPPPQQVYNPPPQQQPYGQLPYSYPPGQQPQPKKMPRGPEYQYAPHPAPSRSGGQGGLAREVEELKAHERHQERRLDMLESRISEREEGRSLNPTAAARGFDGPVYHMPTKGRSQKEIIIREEPRPTRSSGCYVVRRGDSLGLIAKQNGVSKSALVNANNIRNPDKLVVGQKLVIPGCSVAAAPTKTSSSHKRVIVKVEGPRYVVSKSTHGKTEVCPRESAPSVVVEAPRPGVIPPPSGSRGVTSYRVEPGDTIEVVARNFGTTVAEIKSKNKLSQLPPPGDEIIVPLPGSVSS